MSMINALFAGTLFQLVIVTNYKEKMIASTIPQFTSKQDTYTTQTKNVSNVALLLMLCSHPQCKFG